MSEIFILQNQDKLFLNKQKDWVDGRDLNSLFKTSYKDEAINQLVEVSSKDYRQRIKVIQCSANEKGLPVINPDIMPEPLPKAGKDLFADLKAVPANEPAETSELEDIEGIADEIEIRVADEPMLNDFLSDTDADDELQSQQKLA